MTLIILLEVALKHSFVRNMEMAMGFRKIELAAHRAVLEKATLSSNIKKTHAIIGTITVAEDRILAIS
jgi:hypothetical protein